MDIGPSIPVCPCDGFGITPFFILLFPIHRSSILTFLWVKVFLLEKIILPSLVLIIPNSHHCALPYCTLFWLPNCVRTLVSLNFRPPSLSDCCHFSDSRCFIVFFCSCLYFINWQYTGNIRLSSRIYTSLKKCSHQILRKVLKWFHHLWPCVAESSSSVRYRLSWGRHRMVGGYWSYV